MSTRNKKIEVRVTDEEYQSIKELAEYLNLPPSSLARNMLIAAKEDAEFYKKIGVLKGAKKIVDFQEKWQILVRNLNEKDKTATNA